MNYEPIHILSTKKLDDSILIQAASENIFIDCIPFIEIRNISIPGLQQEIRDVIVDGSHTIFTSANAVNAVAKHLDKKLQLNVFCISGKTRKAVEMHFPESSVVDNAPTGTELAEKIVHHRIKSAIFFCGNKRLDTITDTLKSNNIQLKEMVVYETHLTPQKIAKYYDGLLFFSPSAVDSFFGSNEPEKPFAAFTFAGATLKALEKITKEIVVCSTPSEQAMLNTVIDYYKPSAKK